MSTVTLLDGSIGQELVRRNGAPPTPWWSTAVMLDRPDLVRDLHADYLAAGAGVLTTNTYPVLPDRLRGSEYEAEFTNLLGTAVAQAMAARDAAGRGRIAGSLGPLGASYRTDFSHSRDEARTLYGGVIAALEPHVDLFLGETISSLHQAANVVHVIEALSQRPGWISVTVDDVDGAKLRSGEALADLAPLVAGDRIEAVLVNCSRPEVIPAALDVLAGFGKPFGAYANGFVEIAPAFLAEMPTVDVLEARTDLSPESYADHAMTWVGQGASIVGGCCEVGPAHISAIHSRLIAAGHEVI